MKHRLTTIDHDLQIALDKASNVKKHQVLAVVEGGMLLIGLAGFIIGNSDKNLYLMCQSVFVISAVCVFELGLQKMKEWF